MFVFTSLLCACGGGSSTPLDPVDLAHAGSTDLSTTSSTDDLGPTTGGDMPAAAGCNGVYSKSTIAAMRQGASGCYELDSVVTLAVTPTTSSSKSVSFFVQDPAGGLYSAMSASCSSTSTSHPCAAFTTAKSALPARTVTLTGTYIKSAAAKGGFEVFYPDTFVDMTAGTVPAPTALAETDLERGAATASTGQPIAAYFFQIVTATISDKLLMYDWSPTEFASTSSSCKQYGFGLIPTSAGGTAGAACTTTTQPAGQATVNPKEVLVATDFYSGFTYTTDCTCGPKYTDPVPTAGQGVTGSITALLDYDVPYGLTTGYVFLDPMTNADFDIQ